MLWICMHHWMSSDTINFEYTLFFHVYRLKPIYSSVLINSQCDIWCDNTRMLGASLQWCNTWIQHSPRVYQVDRITIAYIAHSVVTHSKTYSKPQNGQYVFGYRSISYVLNVRPCLRWERMGLKKQSAKDELCYWQNQRMLCIWHLIALEAIDFTYVVI